MCWRHCVWCSVLSPSPFTSSWGYHFSEVEGINWGMIENCIFSVLLNLCTLLGLIKVCELEFWAGGVIHYMFAGSEQTMTRACNKHPVVSFTNILGLKPCRVGSVGFRLLLWKYLCQKHERLTINMSIFISMVITLTTESVNSLTSSQNAMLFGVLVF